MAAVKMVIILLAFAGIVAFAHVRTRSAHDVTTKELVGEWRTIATANAAPEFDNSVCDRRTIKAGDNKDGVDVTGEIKMNGSSTSYSGKGKLSHSILELDFSEFNIKSTFHIEILNNGNEMIWQDKKETKHHLLLSRNSEASSESKEKLEKMSKNDHVKVFYLGNHDC